MTKRIDKVKDIVFHCKCHYCGTKQIKRLKDLWEGQDIQCKECDTECDFSGIIEIVPGKV